MSPRSLLLLSILFLFPLTAARENGFQVPPQNQNQRIYFWSSDAPLTKKAAEYPQIVKGTEMILQHMERIENHIIASIKTGRAPAPNDDIRPCNYKEKDFGRTVASRIGFRGWPVPTVTCVSDVFGTALVQTNTAQIRKPPFTVDQLYHAVYERGRVMKENIREIVNNAIDNFTNPDIKWNYPYQTPSQRCVVHPASAYRIQDKWYSSLFITNDSVSANVPLFGRQNLAEFSRVDNGKLGNAKEMCFPVLPPSGEIFENRTDTTTFIASLRGTFEPSYISKLRIEENPAILRSLDASDLFVQQAEDALTASSITILVFPILLNLVPIALLADVSRRTMLLYTLMSDVLTVVPLGIKGVELISIGATPHRTIFVRIAGASNGSRLISTGAELQAAECRANEHVLPTGIAFLVLSVVFGIGGIVAEFAARSYTKSQKLRQLEELKGAGFGVSSSESCRPPSTGSRGHTPPLSLTSADFQPIETVGSPFRNGSFSDSYDTRKKNKGA